jgi:hypothetical protein
MCIIISLNEPFAKLKGEIVIIYYSEYYNELLRMKNKSKTIKERINKLYIWCLNDYFKTWLN